MKDNAVIFLKDWTLLVSSLTPENQLHFWQMFANYEYGADQECDNEFVKPIWNFIKSQMDNMKAKYQEKTVTRNRQNGAKGGRPKKENPSKTQDENNNPKNPVGFSETQITHKDNEKNNEKDKNNVNDILLEKETKEREEKIPDEFILENPLKPPEETSKRKKVAPKKEKVSFRPPSLQEVQNYCNERKNGISSYSFVNFYQSKGWMVGVNKMKDWKAAVRTWEQKRKEETNGKEKKQGSRSPSVNR